MDDPKILIIGKIPPPIGGVTMHTTRLIEHLTNKNFKHFHFINLSKASIPEIFATLRQYPVTHLHTSHVYFQLLAAVLCLVKKRKLIITYHGNLGRYGFFKNLIVNASCRLCFLPIVQNQGSLEKVVRLNGRAIHLSAYIPAARNNPLSEETYANLIRYRKSYRYVFCTNACNLTFDKSNKETYGIQALVTKFSTMPEAALIISDPSARYQQFIKTKTELPDNVLFISTSHDFSSVLNYADAFIRNTTTDGDSISIHEALAAKVAVFATDCVSRPAGCILYNEVSYVDFISDLKNLKRRTLKQEENAAETLMKIYGQLLGLKKEKL